MRASLFAIAAAPALAFSLSIALANEADHQPNQTTHQSTASIVDTLSYPSQRVGADTLAVAGSPLTPIEKSALAGSADALTTALAIANGSVEANPLGAVASILLKPVVIGMIATQPKEDQSTMFSAATSAWGGASINNLCVLAGGGAGCLVAGIVAAYGLWTNTSDERAFWKICKKSKTTNPDINCVYTASKN